MEKQKKLRNPPNRKRENRPSITFTSEERKILDRKWQAAGYDSLNEFVRDRCLHDGDFARPDREAIEILDFQIRRLAESVYLTLEKLDREDEGYSQPAVEGLRQLTTKAGETLVLIQAMLANPELPVLGDNE